MKNNMLGMKPRTSKQIASVGFTLAGGMIGMPFIKFKDARHYRYKKPKEVK